MCLVGFQRISVLYSTKKYRIFQKLQPTVDNSSEKVRFGPDVWFLTYNAERIYLSMNILDTITTLRSAFTTIFQWQHGFWFHVLALLLHNNYITAEGTTKRQVTAPPKCSIICATPNHTEVGRLTLAGKALAEETETIYLGVSIDHARTTPTKTLERIKKATKLVRCLKHENVNTSNMTPLALLKVVQMVVISTTTYGIHLCRKTKEIDEEWETLEEEVASMALGTRMEGRLITMRMLLNIPSLNEMQRMRRWSLTRRVERRATESGGSQEGKEDPNAMRITKVVIRTQPDLAKTEWRKAMRRGCNRKRRKIPNDAGKRPPMLRSMNERFVRQCARWYGGTYPPNVEDVKRSVDATVRNTYEKVSKRMEMTTWSNKGREETVMEMNKMGNVDDRRWGRERGL